MLKNLFARFIITISIFGIILFGSSTVSHANEIVKDVNDTMQFALDTYDKFDGEKDDYITYWVELIVLEAERAALTVAWNSNQSEMERGAYDLASDAIPTDLNIWSNVKDTAKNAAKLAITYSDDLELKKALINKTLEIQKKKVDVATQLGLVNSTYSHYIAHVDAYNSSKWNSPTTTSDDMTATKKGRIPSDEIGVNTDLSMPCSNPSGKCKVVYKASVFGLANIVSMSEGGHKLTCKEKHSRWKTNWAGNVAKPAIEIAISPPDPYWNCPDDPGRCPKIHFHNISCKGKCGKSFPTHPQPHNPHWTDCKEKGKRNALFANLITGECNGHYYSCTQTSADCIFAKNHVNGNGGGSSASLSPSGGSYTASAGDTHTASVSVPSGYKYVYWYIAGPGITGLGLLKETDSGYGSSTTASFSWSIPSYTSGDHVITAYTQLSDNSIVQPSYTLSVGSGSSTDTTDTTPTDTTPSTTDSDDDDTADSDDNEDKSTYAVCTRIVTKKRYVYKGQRRGRATYGWEYYQEACGERYRIRGADNWCITDENGRALKHTSD